MPWLQVLRGPTGKWGGVEVLEMVIVDCVNVSDEERGIGVVGGGEGWECFGNGCVEIGVGLGNGSLVGELAFSACERWLSNGFLL